MVDNVFQSLDQRLIRELVRLGFDQPTPIQTHSIPQILNGKSVLLIAPTGHGKTEAAFFPLIHRLLNTEPQVEGVQILWITPLRALNRDILRRLVSIAQQLEVSVEVRHGDTKPSVRRQQTLKPPKMFISTPETLQALLTGKRIREHLRSVQSVVIDEVHEVAASKRGVQLMVALERLREITGSPFQRIGLSATVGNAEEICAFMSGPETTEIIESPETKEFNFRLEYQPFKYDGVHESPLDGPATRVLELVDSHTSTLIFCNERQTAEALALRLAKLRGSEAGVHHGSLSRTARIEAEKNFKDGRIPYLVCTSSLELGLDIGSVDLVIQFGSPRQVIRLLQRVGRSGHKLEQESKGVILTSRFDDLCESLAVVNRALGGYLERPPVHYDALDVCAHQLVGLAIEYKTLTFEHAQKIITRATPFRNLDSDSFNRIILSLQKEGLLAKDDMLLRPRRKAYAYYFENLSVIPDIPHHKVVNLASNRLIGRLDTGFAEEYGQTGSILVLRGRPWEVVKQDDEKVYVTPVNETKGRIPRWSGELIPVSSEVVAKVSEMWDEIAKRLETPHQLSFEIDVQPEAIETLLDVVKKQQEAFIPTLSKLYVEIGHELVVIHSCNGTRVNETLGRILAALLTSQLGIEIAFHADQFRILFRFERGEGITVGEAVCDGLQTVEPERIVDLLELILLRSPYFARRFLHIARRFGAISRSAKLRSSQLLRIMQYFTDTPMIEEALREFYTDKLDIKKTRSLLYSIKAGNVVVERIYRNRPSPFARQILARFGEFLEPEIPEAYILEQTKKRLLNRKVKLVCLHCGQWSSVRTIKHVDDHPQCKKCNSRLVAGIFPTDDLLERAIRRHRAGQKLNPEEKKALRKGRENANVVLDHGKAALIAMAGRGVGPTVAKRILAGSHERTEKDFYRLILENEKQFIRTREWWTETTT
ncbi:MAG: DEAD/DEAH box helicase [Candidatus Hodarchaeota archaeon]